MPCTPTRASSRCAAPEPHGHSRRAHCRRAPPRRRRRRGGGATTASSLPALVVIGAVIIFPWLFTLWMSAFDWKIGITSRTSSGSTTTRSWSTNRRFLESVVRTFYFTALAVVAPLVLGTIAALIFHRQFPFRGVLRGVFILPMMATPVAIALVWTMMFHPQQGVLNYLLSLVGLPPSLWVYSPTLVIPSLVLVEVWHWTPLVMLIVLGGLAALPTEPYESAQARRRLANGSSSATSRCRWWRRSCSSPRSSAPSTR